MTKLERIEKELEKARERLAEAQSKVKELQMQRTDEENAMIVQIVRKMKMEPHELAAFLDRNKKDLTDPGKKPAVPLEGNALQQLGGHNPPDHGNHHQG